MRLAFGKICRQIFKLLTHIQKGNLRHKPHLTGAGDRVLHVGCENRQPLVSS